ncbi:MAG: hypothetical protein HGA66_07855, partial [Holophaga sp.]|nr:hypothetical protein [Holophaga sp.]
MEGGLVQQFPAPLLQGGVQPLPGPFRPRLDHEGAVPWGLPLRGVLGHQLHRLEHSGIGVNSVCFSPDGSQVASGLFDGTIVIWEASRGHQLDRLKHGG